MVRELGRREFLSTAVAGVAAVAVGGSGLLSGCGGSSGSGALSSAQPAGSAGTPNTFQLSTQHIRRACGACQAHAHNRLYTSREAADADRAHPGCHCQIAGRQTDSTTMTQLFPAGQSIYDKRWT
jgi:hypothetical protein